MSTGIPTTETDASSAKPDHSAVSKRPSGEAAGGTESAALAAKPKAGPGKLTSRERVLAFFLLIFWLNLFAGGMLIDTEPYRCAISWGGVKPVNAETSANHPCRQYWSEDEETKKPVFNRPVFNEEPSPGPWQRAKIWTAAILFYTPLNLAFISAAAGALGTLGSIANLNPDPRTKDSDPEGAASDEASFAPRDRTNPLISGLLRGVFVYLFVISGMLLFDDSPSSTTSDQYVRLAGFLSLFSFFVNYKPSVFSSMLVGAEKLISARGKTAPAEESTEKRFAAQFEAIDKRFAEEFEAIGRKIDQVGSQQLKATLPTSEGPLHVSVGQQQQSADAATAAVTTAEGQVTAAADGAAVKNNGSGPGGAGG